jgi:CBS domain containing-hemolysin-like protein
MSQEELIMMVEEVEQEGSIDSDESELIKNVIEVTEKLAKDILTHRVDVEAVPITATKEEIATVFTETRFSRLPVYEDTIDNIVGVIHQKNLYINGKMTDESVKELLSPVIFIHEFEQVTDLLKRLQREKSHIAVVVDEFGGTLGIITMEDILEELVAEIWDEHDEVEEDIEQVDVDTFVVDCTENIDDFFKFFELECETESVSVGGWISEQLGKIAEEGDTFEYDNIRVTVSATDSHRVESAKIEKIIPTEEEE